MIENFDVDVVVPAHNEEGSIGTVLREFYDVAHGKDGLEVRFVVSEDGSRDNTRRVVEALSLSLPILLPAGGERKGYSRAVLDGLEATSAPLVAFSDGDGQCDPSDLIRLVEALDGHDMVVGYRSPRGDTRFRLLISGAFGVVYRRLFPVRLHDPSCPFLVVRREHLERILEGHPGLLRQGFWWEFNARAASAGLDVVEIPVHHRVRVAGKTQVYRLTKLSGIASEHLLALFALRRELRALRAVDNTDAGSS